MWPLWETARRLKSEVAVAWQLCAFEVRSLSLPKWSNPSLAVALLEPVGCLPNRPRSPPHPPLFLHPTHLFRLAPSPTFSHPNEFNAHTPHTVDISEATFRLNGRVIAVGGCAVPWVWRVGRRRERGSYGGRKG